METQGQEAHTTHSDINTLEDFVSGIMKIVPDVDVWKHQGPRKCKHRQSDGIFVHFESLSYEKRVVHPSSSEKKRVLCSYTSSFQMDKRKRDDEHSCTVRNSTITRFRLTKWKQVP